MLNSQTRKGVFQNKEPGLGINPENSRLFPLRYSSRNHSVPPSSLSPSHTHTELPAEFLGVVVLVEGKISFRSWWRRQRKTNWNRNKGKKISVALGIGVLLRLRRQRELDRRASLWISRRRGSWTIFPSCKEKGASACATCFAPCSVA